jgi:hypothetical protein
MSYFQARLAEVQIPPKKPQKYLFHVPRTNKNRNFDTKRIGVTVLNFYAKTLRLRHFCTQRPQKKTRPGCFLVGFLPLRGLRGPRNR